MGLFELFMGKDASSDWPEVARQELLLDLGESAVNGIRIGAPAVEISKLGRPSNKRPFKNKRFLFDQHGIVIEIENGVVCYFGLPVKRTESDDVGPCDLTIRFPNSVELTVNSNSEVSSLLKNLPKIESSDSDEEETVHYLDVNAQKLELEVSPDGKVRRVNLYPN